MQERMEFAMQQLWIGYLCRRFCWCSFSGSPCITGSSATCINSLSLLHHWHVLPYLEPLCRRTCEVVGPSGESLQLNSRFTKGD